MDGDQVIFMEGEVGSLTEVDIYMFAEHCICNPKGGKQPLRVMECKLSSSQTSQCRRRYGVASG